MNTRKKTSTLSWMIINGQNLLSITTVFITIMSSIAGGTLYFNNTNEKIKQLENTIEHQKKEIKFLSTKADLLEKYAAYIAIRYIPTNADKFDTEDSLSIRKKDLISKIKEINKIHRIPKIANECTSEPQDIFFPDYNINLTIPSEIKKAVHGCPYKENALN